MVEDWCLAKEYQDVEFLTGVCHRFRAVCPFHPALGNILLSESENELWLE